MSTGHITIEIKENPVGKKTYTYTLHEADRYLIARTWISKLGLKIPKEGTLFHFGGRKLVIMDNSSHREITAIDAKRFWKVRYWLFNIQQRVNRLTGRQFR